jgi:hypothetical protein
LLEGLERAGIAALIAVFIEYAKKQVKKQAPAAYAALTPITLKVRFNT